MDNQELVIASATDRDATRVERFQALSAAQYWRSKEKIPSEGIAADEVLLITSIRWVDDKPHTIVLRSHPNNMGSSYEVKVKEKGHTYTQYHNYGEHRFLLDDFLKVFEFEPDHERVRAAELKQVQQTIADLQTELIEVQGDPDRMQLIVEEGLRDEESKAAKKISRKGKPKTTGKQLPMSAADAHQVTQLATGTVANAIGTGITEAGIEQMREAASRQHQIATVQAKWIQGKTEEIAETITAMTPFFEEKAAAALALTEETRTYVAKLMKGIESLDLYVGKDVVVQTLRTGASADREEPLTFMQRKLLMDEELAIWADVNASFDFRKENTFFDTLLKHPELVNQIFPTPRCVMVMAATRRDIDYGDPWINDGRNQENKKVFLLVRDGENLYRVFSSVESHLGTSKLFPSEADGNRIFRGINGSEIKFDDVAYTDRLKVHELHALHYKRFLLLCCGLDHRLKLFGEFYPGPPTLEFVSLKFQEEYCRFVFDDADSGRLLGEARPDVMHWIQEKNKHLRSGSRVLCNWNELLNPSTAPGACRESNYSRGGFRLQYSPANNHDVVIAYREGQSLCVDIEVEGETNRMKDRAFTCKVNLTNFKDGRWEYTDQPFLCLDTVTLEEVHWYIHNREARRSHLDYIRFFKRAQAHLQHEHADEAEARKALAQALEDGKIATGEDATAIIDQAVVAWRAANRGKALPKHSGSMTPAWKSLFDQLYMLAGEGTRQVAEVEAFLHELGYAPLRLVLSGGAKLLVYAAPTTAERDDRLTPHFWVHCITLERGKRGIKEKARRWALLPKQSASETTLHEWVGADDWIFENAGYITLEKKREMLRLASRFKEQLAPYVNPMSAAEQAFHLDEWSHVRSEILRLSRYVRSPVIAVPIGVIYYSRSKELRYLCVGTKNTHGLLHQAATHETTRDKLRSRFADDYNDQEHGLQRYDEDSRQTNPWALFELTVSLVNARHGAYLMESANECHADGRRFDDPRLSSWLARFLTENKAHANAWIDPGVYDSDGNCLLDTLLNNKLPVDFEPLTVREVEIAANDGQVLPKYTHWFDIEPCIEALRSISYVLRGEKPDGVGDYSYCSSGQKETSRTAAHDFIRKQVGSFVNGAELPDAPPAPEGVERWYEVASDGEE